MNMTAYAYWKIFPRMARKVTLGKQLEETSGRRLRSEAIINGRTWENGLPEFARPGLADAKARLRVFGAEIPAGWLWAGLQINPVHLCAEYCS